MDKIDVRIKNVYQEHEEIILCLHHQLISPQSSHHHYHNNYDENKIYDYGINVSCIDFIRFLFEMRNDALDDDNTLVDKDNFIVCAILMHYCGRSIKQILVEKVVQFWRCFQSCCDGCSEFHDNVLPSNTNSDIHKLYDLAQHFQILIAISIDINLMDQQCLSLLAICVRVAIVLGSLPSSSPSSTSSSIPLSLLTSSNLVMYSCVKYPLNLVNSTYQPKVTSITTVPSTVSEFKSSYNELIRTDDGYGFLRFVTRAEAIDILAKYPVGTFLLRPSSLEDSTTGGDGKDRGNEQSGQAMESIDAVLFYISFRGLQFEGVKHATVRREVVARTTGTNKDTAECSLLYRCGKIGPCTSLWEMFHAVEGVLPYEFLYDCLAVPGCLSSASLHIDDNCSGDGNDDDFHVTIDPNHSTWDAIRGEVDGSGMETMFPSSPDRTHKFGYLSADVSAESNENVTPDDGKGTPQLNSFLNQTNQNQQQNEKHEQESTWLNIPILNEDLEDLVMNIIRTLAISQLYLQLSRYEVSSGTIERLLHQSCARCDGVNGNNSSSCMKKLIHPLCLYSQELQRMLTAKLCPLRPFSYNRTKFPNNLMMAEALALDMIFYGCLDLSSTSSTLSSSSLSSQPESSSIMSHHTEMLGATASIADVNIPIRVPMKSINVPPPWITGGSALISNSKTVPSVNNNSRATPSNINNIYVDAFELSDGSNWLTKFKHAKSMQKLLVSEAVQNPTPFNILNWMKENRVLRVLKTGGNMTFTSSQTTCLCYVDPWQVTVINDPMQIKTPELTFATLGRHRYCPLDYEGSYDTLIKLVTNNICLNMPPGPSRDASLLIAKQMHTVWSLLGANGYLISTISACIPQGEKESLVPPSSLGMGNVPGAPAADMYSACIHRYLYRNLLFSRCLMSHRFVAVVNVKILGLKDHTAQKHKGLIQAGPMELYSVATLCRSSKFALNKRIDSRDSNKGVDVANNIVSISSLGSSDISKYGINTVVNNAVKVEPFAGKEHYTEYPWKEATIFRFPLPEHVLFLHDDNITNTSSSSTSSSSFKEDDDEYEIFFKSPPKLVKLSVYERTFFSDNKLGDIQLPLSTIGEDTVFKEWIPLSHTSTNRSQAWFLHVQVEVNYALMSLYDSPMGSGSVARMNGSPNPNQTTVLPKSPSPSSSPVVATEGASVLPSPQLERKQSSSDGDLHSTIVNGVSNLTDTRSRHSSNDLSSSTGSTGEGGTTASMATDYTTVESSTPTSPITDSDSKSLKASRFDNLSEMGIL